MCVCVLVAW